MILIRESHVEYLKASNEESINFSLLLNPTVDEIREVKKEEFANLKYKINPFYLRALIVNKTKLYAWCGDMMTHFKMMKHLKVEHGKDVIPLGLQLTQNCQIDTMSYSPEIRETIYDNEDYTPASMEGEHYYNSKLVPILKNCDAIKNIATSQTDWELVNDY
jgi:hypothetical protein